MIGQGSTVEIKLAAVEPRATLQVGVAIVLVAQVYAVPLDALTAATRTGQRAAEARQVAMYLAHVVFRMSLAGVARGFGRDRTTVRHACRQVEQRREDPELDRFVAWLEALLRHAAGKPAQRVQLEETVQ